MTTLSVKRDGKRPLSEVIAEKLIQYIIDSKLEIGSKIPNEFVLAEEVGASRATIREAVKILVSQNVLEIRRGQGTYVASKTGISKDPLGFQFVSDKMKLAKDLLEIRMLLEPAIAKLAAQNATDEEIQEISNQCDLVEKIIKKNDGLEKRQYDHSQADVRLHELIAKSSGNLIVEKLIPIINSSVLIFVELTNSKLHEETIITHRQIVDAIKNHDGEKAYEAMYRHIKFNQDFITSL